MMYSRKTQKYFRYPKGYGRIKNPDGFGKVGNPVCLLPEEKIHKNSEIIEISKLKQNQKILTHTGNYERINATFSRRYKGKIVILKNKLGKVVLTPEHLVYAISVPREEKFLRNKNKRKLIPAWYHAEQLKKRDIILYPVLKEKKDVEHIKVNIPELKWDFKSKRIPKKLLVNSDLLRLFGYFLAEGNIQDKPCSTFIMFTLNIREKEIMEDIKRISKNLFGLDIKIKEKPERKTLVVYLFSAKLARFFKKLFRGGAENKSIPDFIMNLSSEKQKSLIFGLWKGDGYVNLNRRAQRAGYSTISYQLAQQIKTLLLRQKIVTSIYEDREREVDGVKHKKAYRIHIGQRDSLKRLCDILKVIFNPKSSYEAISSWFDGNYLYTPITDKRILNHKGEVYNLEVENSHSFTSEAFCLHNCGDVMELYIKVGKNKKGEEVIRDIKWLTFGCLAAIASSSVVVKLAKGKTLKEAMKITRKDVVKELGYLPPIKIHCSVLAEDALKAAIEDYKKKNGK